MFKLFWIPSLPQILSSIFCLSKGQGNNQDCKLLYLMATQGSSQKGVKTMSIPIYQGRGFSLLQFHPVGHLQLFKKFSMLKIGVNKCIRNLSFFGIFSFKPCSCVWMYVHVCLYMCEELFAIYCGLGSFQIISNMFVNISPLFS